MIDVDGVTVRYDAPPHSSDRPELDENDSLPGGIAVDDVSLRIDDGEFVVLAGANGSGKSTLVRTFNGLVEPTMGTVSVDGTPVESDLVSARSAVAMVFQTPRDQFVAPTVAADVAFGPENLGLPHEEIDRRVATALDAVDLTGRGDTRIATLSGGERQRVAIAGAMAMAPTHLVCDEPFTGLDEPARTTVLKRLHSLAAEGTSIIVVTHDLRDVLGLTDRLIGLDDGRLVVNGPPASVIADLADHGVRVPPTESPRR
jgi:biotin transport system ATP-binding protein